MNTDTPISPDAVSSGTAKMPPEWAPHERTWMAFPPANETFGELGSDSLTRARRAWTAVAMTIARYEPVTMAVSPGDMEAAELMLDGRVDLVPIALDDAWIRDSGLTFVHDAHGRVRGVDWIFNGWGAQPWASWESDGLIGQRMAEHLEVPHTVSQLVNEGGGFHIDAHGTVLLTETVQLDQGRNPGLTTQQVEDEIHTMLGTTRALWLPRGLTRDYDEFGTRGHVDIVASFTETGAVLLHRQDDPRHPDYEVTRSLREVLTAAYDAKGNPLQVIDVPAPKKITDIDGELNDWSYINHYVTNGAVILCAFDDPQDEVAARILVEAYPGRTVELVDAQDIFAFGGGIHCITQQQPRPVRAATPGGER